MGFLADYWYAIAWWTLLPLIDTWNFRHRRLSMWRGGKGAHFVAFTLPASVIVWLLFEALNYPAPQWRYRGGIEGMWPKVLFGFVAFSTVVPIMVESWWLVAGGQCLPEPVLRLFRKHSKAAIALACAFAAIPFFNDSFWFNQGIWLIPALALLPFVRSETCGAREFTRAVVVSGVLAGIAWEALNYPARTHWEYLILPNVPHLFYMPIPGYIGFVPFAFSMLAVHEFLRPRKPGVVAAVVLYIIAFAGLYWLTVLYVEAGLWMP